MLRIMLAYLTLGLVTGEAAPKGVKFLLVIHPRQFQCRNTNIEMYTAFIISSISSSTAPHTSCYDDPIPPKKKSLGIHHII